MLYSPGVHHLPSHYGAFITVSNNKQWFQQGYSAESQLVTVTEDISYAMVTNYKQMLYF